MNKLTIKILLLIFICTSSLFSNSSFTASNTNEIYFFPKQADDAKDRILKLMKKSKKKIYISMYNFSYKKFAKQLVKTAKKGVEIIVIFDKSKVKKDDKIYEYLKKNNIKVLIPKMKLHTKIALFDDETIVLGSSNWTKDSFKENYEVILFSKDKKIIKDTLKFLNNLQKNY